MNISILVVGKSKTAFYDEAVAEYAKRLSRWAKISWQVIPTSDKNTESDALLRALPKDGHVILLDERGHHWSTIELSDRIEKLQNAGTQNLIYIIGGAHGVGQNVRDRANQVWSLSNLIFPHEMVRLILTEQLYRAHTILNNGSYHHE